MNDLIDTPQSSVPPQTNTMKICSACLRGLPKLNFSNKQWQRMQHQRRCKVCVTENRVSQPNASPLPHGPTGAKPLAPPCGDDDGVAACYICLGEGTDEDSGEPLRRDCSCRGSDAGFSHLSCLVEYAKQKSMSWDGKYSHSFQNPWIRCFRCDQLYQNELANDMASEFVSFVGREYPGDSAVERFKNVLALDNLLVRLAAKGPQLDIIQGQITDAERVASRLLSLIESIHTDTINTFDAKTRQIEAATHSNLGSIIGWGDSEENAKRAVECFEKSRDISKAAGFSRLAIAAESNILFAKSKREGNPVCSEEQVKKYRDLHELSVARNGHADFTTLDAGSNLASALWSSDHGIEAQRLLAKLAATSTRVHGPDHVYTKRIESKLEALKERYIFTKLEGRDEGFLFQLLGYINERFCIIQGPIKMNRELANKKVRIFICGDDIRSLHMGVPTAPANLNERTGWYADVVCYKEENVCEIPAEDICGLVADTPVICTGIEGEFAYLNGKIGDVSECYRELGLYALHFEDPSLGTHLVSIHNFRILFDIPDNE